MTTIARGFGARLDGPGLQTAAIGATAAVAGGYAVAGGLTVFAFAAFLLPLVAWLLSRPVIAAAALGMSIPALQSIAGGSFGRNVVVADVLLVIISGAIVLEAAVTGGAPALRALRAVALPVGQYAVVLLLLLAVHLGPTEFVKTGQRLELFLLPLLVGAFLAMRGAHVRLLQAYVIASAVLAAVWPFDSLGMQKNPAGQLIANAIVLLVAVRSLRRLLVCMPVLVIGLLLTQSRGAILAAAIGVVLVLALHAGPRARLVLTRAAPLAVLAALAFALAPASARDRLTSFSSRPDAPGSYALQVRERYTADAHRIIDAQPWSGIGVGNYWAGDARSGTGTRDPHQVLLLQAAEGGYGLAASFVLLVGGAALALFRHARGTELGTAAIAVLLATVAHGFVDVYWVRGTPLLGWLLVGMACGTLAARREEAA
jgi:hypothetical protein